MASGLRLMSTPARKHSEGYFLMSCASSLSHVQRLPLALAFLSFHDSRTTNPCYIQLSTTEMFETYGEYRSKVRCVVS